MLAVNVTANWRLIRTLDPLLRRSEAGRVIFVTSSGVARSGRAYWAPYSVSKAALETLAKTYANETADSPIKVNIVDPGATATAMRAEAYPGEDQDVANARRGRGSHRPAGPARHHADTGRSSERKGGYRAVTRQHHAVIGGLDALRQLAPTAPRNRDPHAYG